MPVSKPRARRQSSDEPRQSEGPSVDRPASPGSRRATFAAAAVVVAAGLAAYANSFAGEFVLDDHLWIDPVQNPSIRQLSPLGPVLFPPQDALSSGRPVVNLSLAANYALGGTNVWGYHAVNVAIHLLAALVLFGIVRRSLLTSRLRDRFGRFATGLALAVALLWVVHPLGTAAVTYIIQRTEALAGWFYLLTLYCVIRGATSGESNPSLTLRASQLDPSLTRRVSKVARRVSEGRAASGSIPSLTRRVSIRLYRVIRGATSIRSMAWYVSAVVSCLLGMATKEVVATAPLVVLLYDRALLSDSFAEALKRRWALYLAMAASWGVVVWCLVSTGFHSNSAGFGIEQFTPLGYAATEPGVILHYLRLAVWPVGLVLDYDWPAAKAFGEIVPPSIAIAALVGLTIWGLVKNNPVALLGAWFFVILAPTSSFVPIRDAAFDHRMYLPLAAVIALFVLGGFAFLRRLVQRWEARPSLTRRASIEAGHPSLTRRASIEPLIAREVSEESLEARSVSEEPIVARSVSEGPMETRRVSDGRWRLWLLPWSGVAVVAAFFGWRTVVRNSQFADAEIIWSATVDARPANARAHSNLAAILYDRGKYDEAVDHSRRALALRPDYPEAETNLGAALAKKRQFDEAFVHLDRALELRPGEKRATELKCEALVAAGKLDSAIRVCELILSFDPHNAKFRFLLGDSLAKLGKTDDAIEQYKLAIADEPDSATAHNVVGGLLARRGQLDEAVPHFEAAIRMAPSQPDPQYNLGMIFYGRGNDVEAERYWRAAVQLRPDAAEYLRPLAWVLATSRDPAARNGREAVELAQRAMAASPKPDPNIVGTLAAAYAESGNFAQAVANAQKARDLAEQQGDKRLAKELAERVADYRAGKPYRESKIVGK